MINRVERYDSIAGGVVVTEADSEANTVTTYTNGVLTSTRPMTAEEASYYDTWAVQETERINRDTMMRDIQQNIATLKATIDSLNVITATANSTINANPASFIKDAAREAKTIARQTIRIAKVLVGDLADTDTGAA